MGDLCQFVLHGVILPIQSAFTDIPAQHSYKTDMTNQSLSCPKGKIFVQTSSAAKTDLYTVAVLWGRDGHFTTTSLVNASLGMF